LNIGLVDGRIAVITTQPIRGRDTVDAHGLVVAPGFIDLHAHGQTPETYRFYSLDGVTTALELELGTSDVAAWYRERSAGGAGGERINYGVSIGHRSEEHTSELQSRGHLVCRLLLEKKKKKKNTKTNE